MISEIPDWSEGLRLFYTQGYSESFESFEFNSRVEGLKL